MPAYAQKKYQFPMTAASNTNEARETNACEQALIQSMTESERTAAFERTPNQTLEHNLEIIKLRLRTKFQTCICENPDLICKNLSVQ
mmetsp:Transcript_66386/g.125607  ORF Transcript_66386/g.125607 Transcript_66386/m.125607 type:complete len:87 (-) Transcript_66386:644-904(-)